MPQSMDDYQWVKKHVGQLMALGAECRQCQPTVANTFGPWTALKLCALKNYVDIYTRILNDSRVRRLHYDGLAYLDVFAGSGVNLIGEHMTPLAGSSPIATRFHYKSQPFDRFYALEINPDYCSALQERLTKFVPQNAFKIIPGDADKNIGKAIEDLEKRKLHYLAFVDYEGMKGFSWESLEKLLQHDGDLWITFICPGFARVQGRARWSDADSVTLEKALSPEVVRKSNDVWELADNFVARIKEYRPKVVEMDVRSGDGYYYRLIYATRQTWGGSAYVSSVEALKKRVESVSGKFVQLVVDVLENRRRDMDSFT